MHIQSSASFSNGLVQFAEVYDTALNFWSSYLFGIADSNSDGSLACNLLRSVFKSLKARSDSIRPNWPYAVALDIIADEELL